MKIDCDLSPSNRFLQNIHNQKDGEIAIQTYETSAVVTGTEMGIGMRAVLLGGVVVGHGVLLLVCVCARPPSSTRMSSKIVVRSVVTKGKTDCPNAVPVRAQTPVKQAHAVPVTPSQRVHAKEAMSDSAVRSSPKPLMPVRPATKRPNTQAFVRPPSQKRSPARPATPVEGEQLRSLVADLEETIAKIERDYATVREVDRLEWQEKREPVIVCEGGARADAAEASVDEHMVRVLQRELLLPEFGSVKVELQVSEYGRIVSVRILQAGSAVNAKYLSDTLPGYTFPEVGWLHRTEESRRFVITFYNDM